MNDTRLIGRWLCAECRDIVSTGEILHAASPFDKDDELDGCPHCGATNSLNLLCDEPGCRALVMTGWPSPQGYRSTCGQHFKYESDI